MVIIDPNARGEGMGMETFERSVRKLFLNYFGYADAVGDSGGNVTNENSNPRNENNSQHHNNQSSPSTTTTKPPTVTVTVPTPQQHQPPPIYILAHSASGGQLVRHLRSDPALLPFLRAIAFTDSTHNVQWCKHHPELVEMLQSENCIYLRSNDVGSMSGSFVRVSSRGKEIGNAAAYASGGSSGGCGGGANTNDSTSSSSSSRGGARKTTKHAGMEADTDHFWRHRFGNILTLWAGTADHALSNWAGHERIWDHFDDRAVIDGCDDDDDDGAS